MMMMMVVFQGSGAKYICTDCLHFAAPWNFGKLLASEEKKVEPKYLSAEENEKYGMEMTMALSGRLKYRCAAARICPQLISYSRI